MHNREIKHRYFFPLQSRLHATLTSHHSACIAADVAGEGEIKLLSYLYAQPPEDTFLLVGSDADLVVMALSSLRPYVMAFVTIANVITISIVVLFVLYYYYYYHYYYYYYYLVIL